MSSFSGLFGGYRHNLMSAVSGLGKILGPHKALTKSSRAVVRDFIQGEPGEASCKKDGSGCAVQSDGNTLTVNGFKLAERVVGLDTKGSMKKGNALKVCLPPKAVLERDAKSGKLKETEGTREVKSTAQALLRVLGAGVSTRTLPGDPLATRIISSGGMRSGGARVAVPGECLTVMLTPAMHDAASDMQMARGIVSRRTAAGEKVSKKAIQAQLRQMRKGAAQAKAIDAEIRRKEAAAKKKAAKEAEKAAKDEAAAAKKVGDTATAAAATADAKVAAAEVKVAAKAEAKATADKKAATKAAKAPAKKSPAKKSPAKKK